MKLPYLLAKNSHDVLNPTQTGGGFSNPPSGKIVITPTPKEL